MGKLKSLISGGLFAVGFFGVGVIIMFAYQTIDYVSGGTPLTVDLMNDVISRVRLLYSSSGSNILEVKGEIKLVDSVTDSVCDSDSKGTILFSGDSFLGCDGSDWKGLVGSSSELVTVEINGSARMWTDGTYSKSCDEYKNPIGGYNYLGSIGDGLYRVDPDGSGANSPFEVYCDMTTNGGGWTLLSIGTNVQGWRYHDGATSNVCTDLSSNACTGNVKKLFLDSDSKKVLINGRDISNWVEISDHRSLQSCFTSTGKCDAAGISDGLSNVTRFSKNGQSGTAMGLRQRSSDGRKYLSVKGNGNSVSGPDSDRIITQGGGVEATPATRLGWSLSNNKTEIFIK